MTLTVLVLIPCLALGFSGQEDKLSYSPVLGPAVLPTGDSYQPQTVSPNLASLLATNQPPTANFTFVPSSPLVGTPVTLDASRSFDPDGSIQFYLWDFGDGSPLNNATLPTTTHSYANAQTYIVKLNVTDNLRAVASTYRFITVKNFLHPIPSFSWTPQLPLAGETVFFDGSASTDPDGVIISYLWDFGDGTSGTGIGVLHSYSSSGVYQVTLSVTDDSGLTSELSTNKPRAVNVLPPLTLAVSANATEGFAPLFISFSPQVSGGKPPYTFSWDFGDGLTSTRPSPVHNYTAPRGYRVEVTVTDSLNHTVSQVMIITVTLRPLGLTFLGISEATLKIGGAMTALSVFPLLIYMVIRRRKGGGGGVESGDK